MFGLGGVEVHAEVHLLGGLGRGHGTTGATRRRRRRAPRPSRSRFHNWWPTCPCRPSCNPSFPWGTLPWSRTSARCPSSSSSSSPKYELVDVLRLPLQHRALPGGDRIRLGDQPAGRDQLLLFAFLELRHEGRRTSCRRRACSTPSCSLALEAVFPGLGRFVADAVDLRLGVRRISLGAQSFASVDFSAIASLAWRAVDLVVFRLGELAHAAAAGDQKPPRRRTVRRRIRFRFLISHLPRPTASAFAE